MPILKNITSPNGAVLGFHKAKTGSVNFESGEAVVTVASWATEEAHNAGLGLAWSWPPMSLPIARLVDVDAALLEISGSPFLGGTLVIDGSLSLQSCRDRKIGELKQVRDELVFRSFVWDGSVFDSTERSQALLLGMYVDANAGDFQTQPYRLFDNTWRVLEAADMQGIWAAMKDHVKNQFMVFAYCEAQALQAATREVIEAVSWPVPEAPGEAP